MTSLERLLELQDHDSAIDRLRAQRERLPRRQRLSECQAEARELEAQLDQLRDQRDEARREEKRLEDHIAILGERIEDVESAMYGGKVSSPRELQAMQAEVEQFKRQLRSLEDQELDVMERRESLEGELGQLEEKLGELRRAIGELEQALGVEEAAVDAELASHQDARDRLVHEIPADLLALYDQVRAKNRGVGVARLVGATCQGCHLALPAMEVDRIKREPPDALVRCEQCGCILVR